MKDDEFQYRARPRLRPLGVVREDENLSKDAFIRLLIHKCQHRGLRISAEMLKIDVAVNHRGFRVRDCIVTLEPGTILPNGMTTTRLPARRAISGISEEALCPQQQARDDGADRLSLTDVL